MRKTKNFALASMLALAATLAGCNQSPTEPVPDADASEASSEVPAAVPAATEGTVYTFTPATTVEFTGSKTTGSHNGGFKGVAGTVVVPGEDLSQAVIDVVIDMKSVYTDTENLTVHLMSADFFEVETYPEARFASTSIVKEGESYTISGDFTLHGITKPITFPATMSLTDGKIVAEAAFDINRFDYGIKYAGKADDLIRENVNIILGIEATK